MSVADKHLLRVTRAFTLAGKPLPPLECWRWYSCYLDYSGGIFTLEMHYSNLNQEHWYNVNGHRVTEQDLDDLLDMISNISKEKKRGTLLAGLPVDI